MLMVLNERLDIKEKMFEFKMCYKFSNDLSLTYKKAVINDTTIVAKNKDF